MRTLSLAIAALLASSAGAALAQNAPMSGPMTPTAYVTAAGQSDEFEVKEGKIAETRGGTSAVRTFGRRMVMAHTKSTQMVKSAAAASGLPSMPPPPLTSSQQQMIADLSTKSGAGFDKLYVQQQLQAHEQALTVQQNYAQNGGAPALKAAAAKIVPVVESHISMLHSLQTGM